MESQIVLDTSLFLWSVVFGFFCGLYYEIFRFLRLAFPHKVPITAMEDLIFWFPLPFAFILFTFAFSDGIIRWFSIAGILMGFFLYLNTLGRILLFFSDHILRLIRSILRFLFQKTVYPILIVFKNITNWLFAVCKRYVIIVKMKKQQKELAKIDNAC